VTVEALPLPAAGKRLVRHARTIAEQAGVASQAVLLNNFLAGFPDVDSLRLFAQCEDRRMTHAVAGLEIVLPEYIVVGYMTGITIRDTLMGAV